MKKYLKFIVVTALLLLFVSTAFANEDKSSNTEAPPKEGTIELTCIADGKWVDGVTFTLMKVADVKMKNTALNESGKWYVSYDLVSQLKDLSESNMIGEEMFFDKMSTSECVKLAKKLAERDLDVVAVKETDRHGVVAFENLPLGMYLVVQTSASGTASDYTAYAPFLISLPMELAEDTLTYGIKCYPKTTIVDNDDDEGNPPDDDEGNPPDTDEGNPPDEDEPKTGDETSLLLYIIGIVMSVALMVTLVTKKSQ